MDNFDNQDPRKQENSASPDASLSEEGAGRGSADPVSSGGQEEIAPDGSYGISFTSGQGKYSAGDGYNAYGFNANGSGRYSGTSSAHAVPSAENPAKSTGERQKKGSGRNGLPALVTLAVVLLVCSILLTVFSVTLLYKTRTACLPDPRPGGESVATDHPTMWVNPGNIESGDAFSNVAAKTVNSVVVITAKTSAGTSSGAGVIWATAEGGSYIVTCNHVVEGTSDIQITFNNDETCHAEWIGGDSRTDIAVLYVKMGNLPAAVLPGQEYEMKLGQSVIVIGNPLGTLGNSVSNGILSSLSRRVSVEKTTMELIQTNAAINEGNSGGGMFDMNGQLIGLVNAKVGGSSIDNIGFAIPYTVLKDVTTELIEKGYVSGRPRLGITTVTIDSQATYNAAIAEYPDLEPYVTVRTMFGTTINPGVYVVDASGVTAYADGSDSLSFGDCIVGFGSTQVSSHSDLVGALNNYNAGDTIQLTVHRRNRTVIIELILSATDK